MGKKKNCSTPFIFYISSKYKTNNEGNYPLLPAFKILMTLVFFSNETI